MSHELRPHDACYVGQEGRRGNGAVIDGVRLRSVELETARIVSNKSSEVVVEGRAVASRASCLGGGGLCGCVGGTLEIGVGEEGMPDGCGRQAGVGFREGADRGGGGGGFASVSYGMDSGYSATRVAKLGVLLEEEEWGRCGGRGKGGLLLPPGRIDVIGAGKEQNASLDGLGN